VSEEGKVGESSENSGRSGHSEMGEGKGERSGEEGGETDSTIREIGRGW
jgi:hypothetical protein